MQHDSDAGDWHWVTEERRQGSVNCQRAGLLRPRFFEFTVRTSGLSTMVKKFTTRCFLKKSPDGVCSEELPRFLSFRAVAKNSSRNWPPYSARVNLARNFARVVCARPRPTASALPLRASTIRPQRIQIRLTQLLPTTQSSRYCLRDPLWAVTSLENQCAFRKPPRAIVGKLGDLLCALAPWREIRS
jgi:hypothetical protein